MALASDKLHSGYLRRKMPAIVSKVKVKEVMVHLPCLTAHDREIIEAKRETYGNFDAMVLLLDCLKRRENWPELFIEALESCEHPTIAADIRAEYDTLRGVDNSSPGSPSTTVTRAHVHPAPPVDHLSGPAAADAAVAPPAEASAPQSSPPLGVPIVSPLPQSPPEQQPKKIEAVSPPEPVPEPSQPSETEVAALPSTPPPSPETPLTPADSPQKEEVVIAHQEPEENSESYFMDVPVELNLMPEVTPPGVGLVETYSPLHPDLLETTATTEIRQPESPPQVNSDVTDGSSFPTLTPEKPPVQDTMPPVDKVRAVVLEPEVTSEPPTMQDIENNTETETAATASPQPDDDRIDTSVTDDSSVCLSKPDVLISVPPPSSQNGPTLPAYNPPVELYSGGSALVETSDPAPESVSCSSIPACSTDTSTTKDTDSGLTCQENNFEPKPQEPAENHLESTCQRLEMMDVQEHVVPCQENSVALNLQEPAVNHVESTRQSLEMIDVQEHVVHLSTDVSILDGDGPNSAQVINSIINTEADKTIDPSQLSLFNTIAADHESSLNAPSSPEPLPEPALSVNKPEPPTLPPAEKERHACQSNVKYTAAAAGVAALALVMAWKFRQGVFLKG